MSSTHSTSLRIGAGAFIITMAAVAVLRDNYPLAGAAILTGILFIALARSRTRRYTDERELAIREKASQLTYGIFAPAIGITAFLLMFPSRSGMRVFSKGEWVFMESAGMILTYLALLLIALYAVSYRIYSSRFGGGRDDE